MPKPGGGDGQRNPTISTMLLSRDVLMLQSVAHFFDSQDFMPHGHCFLWEPGILWLHILSDAVIVSAYFSLPFALLVIIRKRKDLPFQGIFLLFGAFILLCGTTHLMGIWVLWYPDYAVEGIIKALTAIASISTFFVVVKLIPQILLLPSPSQLASVNQELRDANNKLALLYEHSRESGQARLRAVVDNVLDGLITIDERGNIESFNPACERIFGYESSEAIGKNIKMLMPEPYHSEHDDYLSHYRETGEAHIIGTAGREVSAKRKDGSVFPMDLSISAFQLEDGRHFSGIIRDITARKQSEARLRAVVDHAIDGLITIGERGIVESFNPACERIFGYGADEVIGQNIRVLMPEPYHSEHDGYLHHYIETGDAKIIGTAGREVRAKRKDGSVFPMDLAVSAFELKDGRHFSGIIRDITARKAAEQEIRDNAMRLNAVFDTVVDGLITINSQAIIQSFNASAERIFGYGPEEVIGQNIRMLMPEPYRGEHDSYVGNYLETGIAKIIGIGREVTAKRKDGSIFPMELGISAFNIGAETAFVGIVRDITARSQSETTLLRYTTELERRNKELDDFAHIASHDLKEPLRGLFNNAKFLEEDYGDKIDAMGMKRLQRLCYLTQRMETLVNDLLYFSRLGRQELAIGPADINTAIRDIESMMETTLKEKNAFIDIPKVFPEIVCDKTGVTEIFRNLITNAVKYNDREKKIVEVGYVDEVQAEKGIETQVFYVKDNGIGIEAEFHEEIFRIFKRLNEEDDDKKGTGVGLTFVRKIVDRHGGRIWLESELGKGSTFYFTLTPGVARAAAA
jgi:two-component system sensor kinase FixL